MITFEVLRIKGVDDTPVTYKVGEDGIVSIKYVHDCVYKITNASGEVVFIKAKEFEAVGHEVKE